MILLTFDTDHMTENMMARFVRDILPADLPFTFFCHQPFECLAQSANEIAAHPFLANSRDWPGTIRDLCGSIAALTGAPPVGFRAHSLVTSQLLMIQAAEAGFRYVSSMSVAPEQNVPCFRSVWDICEVPIRYMDNMDLWARDKTGLSERCFSRKVIDMAMDPAQTFCFDFHPLHIYLNTSRFSDYEAWVQAGRPELTAPVERAAYGVRDFFLDLCSEARKRNASLSTCRDATGAIPRRLA